MKPHETNTANPVDFPKMENTMNERIRELAEQALFESDFDDEQNIKITMDIFAQLIYNDIITVVAAQALSNHSAMDVFKNLKRIYEGVEE